MATKYLQEYASEADFLADAVDAPSRVGVAAVGEILVINKGGSVVEVVDETATQTLTNKTLTAPTLTAPVITGAMTVAAGATLTSPTINGATGTVASEVVAAANVITASESGKTFFLASATEFASTLPAPALGLKFTFIVSAAPSGASYTIVTEGGCQILAGHVLTSGFADSGSDVETTATGTTITFVDSVAVVGDRVELISDGTSWFASCICAVEAGITITG